MVSPRVVRVAGAALTTNSALMAALLDADANAVVSHESAAALWDFTGFRCLPAVVTGVRPTGRSEAALARTLHRPRRLLAHHVVELDGLRVTTPTRVLFDLASLPDVRPRRIARLLDSAWSRGLTNHAALTRMLGEVGGRGRSGTVLMRGLIHERPIDHRPPESNLESRFNELARRAGIRSFERQIDIGGEEGWIGRVDFLDIKRRIIVEVDSERFHTALTDRQRDALRHASLRDAGYIVESVTDHDLFHEPEAVIARIQSVLRSTVPRSG